MRKIPYLRYSITALLTLSIVTTGIMSISSLVYAQNRSAPLEDRLVNSYPVSYEIKKDEIDSNFPFEINNNELFYKYKDTSNQTNIRKVGEKDGRISNNKGFIAFIDKSKAEGLNLLKVSEIDSKKSIKEVSIENNSNKYVSSWSKNDTKFVVSSSSDSTFHNEMEIYSITKDLKKIANINMYSRKQIWIDDINLFFISMSIDCDNKTLPDNCANRSIWLSKYDAVNDKVLKLKKIDKIRQYPPVIQSLDVLDNRLVIKYSVLNPKDYADISSLTYYTFEYNLI